MIELVIAATLLLLVSGIVALAFWRAWQLHVRAVETRLDLAKLASDLAQLGPAEPIPEPSERCTCRN